MKRLSARSTFVYKFVIPAMFLVFDGVAIVMLERADLVEQVPRVPLMLALIVPAVVTFWTSRPLKYVAIDGATLHVSDYFREVRIPVSQVREVVLTSGRKQVPRVTLKLGWPCEFGDTLYFVPSIWALADIEALRVSSRPGGPP